MNHVATGQRTWPRQKFCLCLLAAFIFTACRRESDPAVPNDAQRYGLHEAIIHRQMIERAAALANVILGPEIRRRFQITWPASGLFPEFRFNAEAGPSPEIVLNEAQDVCEYRGYRRVSVYLIDDDQLGSRENSFIPDGCSCVFINARSIDAILDSFGVGPGTQLSAYPEYERASVYAAVLLHEIGHLQNGDVGSYTEPVALTPVDITQGLNSWTSKEVTADRFAVGQIHAALSENNWRPFLGLGTGSASIANHLLYVINVAVNTYDYRNDPWGYLNGQPTLERFAARSYSHLNLQLRLLIMLYQMEPDANKREHLKVLLGSALDRDFKIAGKN